VGETRRGAGDGGVGTRLGTLAHAILPGDSRRDRVRILRRFRVFGSRSFEVSENAFVTSPFSLWQW
ncbi:hypothetical protein CCR97_07400, partial [Rhodoplanes elegans]|nr:hypothetical protein [Rhodoplanes elegans]